MNLVAAESSRQVSHRLETDANFHVANLEQLVFAVEVSIKRGAFEPDEIFNISSSLIKAKLFIENLRESAYSRS